MPKTLLLADDSVTIQKVVGISFANEDIVLLTVDNGDDAVARAQEVRPDVVLADVVMPGRNGYEVCEAIKGDPNLKGVPVLLLTGTFEAFDEDRAQRVGADGHITKPFEAQALVDQVNALLARSAPAAAAPAAETPAPGDSMGLPEAAPAPAESYDFFDDEATEPGTPQPEPVQATTPSPAETAGPAADDDLGLGDTGGQSFRFDTTPELGDELDVPAGPGPNGADAAGDETVILPAGTDLVSSGPGGSSSAQTVQSFAAGDLDDEPTAEPVFDALDEVPTPTPAPVAHATLDPEGGRNYDVSSTDLGPVLAAPDPEPPASDEAVMVSEPIAAPEAAVPPPIPEAAPIVEAQPAPPLPMAAAEPPPLPEAAAVEALPEAMAGPMGEPIEEPTEEPMAESIAEPAPPAANVQAQPAAGVQPEPAESVEPLARPEPAAVGAGELSEAMREEIRARVEKVAWEAFGRITETLVKDAVERIEKVAWEVVPQMAETLVQEEIRRLKGDE